MYQRTLGHSVLDETKESHSNGISDWGDRMVELNKRDGIKILGGAVELYLSTYSKMLTAFAAPIKHFDRRQA
ncbi:MAG: hypothetical protein GY834_03525 [Bacteroidetes bacterium]|nr:hypothetical protein [Bacteroidota bacterium]